MDAKWSKNYFILQATLQTLKRGNLLPIQLLYKLTSFAICAIFIVFVQLLNHNTLSEKLRLHSVAVLIHNCTIRGSKYVDDLNLNLQLCMVVGL